MRLLILSHPVCFYLIRYHNVSVNSTILVKLESDSPSTLSFRPSSFPTEYPTRLFSISSLAVPLFPFILCPSFSIMLSISSCHCLAKIFQTFLILFIQVLPWITSLSLPNQVYWKGKRMKHIILCNWKPKNVDMVYYKDLRLTYNFQMHVFTCFLC